MSDAVHDADVSLPAMLASRARTVPMRNLVLDMAIGTAVAIAVMTLHPKRWWVVLTSAAMCFVMFGAWGLVDRAFGKRQRSVERREDPVSAGDMPDFSKRQSVDAGALMYRIGLALIAGIGGVAALLTIFGFVAISLGTIIS